MPKKYNYNFRLSKNPWRLLIIVLLVLGIFFRFANLEQKPYWGDESLTSQRISGYTDQDFQAIVLQGEEMKVVEVQDYQRPSPQRGLMDAINAFVKHGEHPPLYYLMARFWMQLFQNIVTTPRSLSAVISLVAMPCIYLLCWELFESSLIGWVAIGLLAISPLQILYAQEARQYSLWTVTVLLSSWALLRAMRLHSKMNWGVYAVTLALGFYTHLISVIVAIGHGIYVLVHDSFRFSKTLIAYLLASLAGCLLFLPWIGVMIADSQVENPSPGWSKTPTPLPSLVQSWLVNISHIFVDLNDSFVYGNLWIYALTSILVLYAIYFLCNHTPKRVWLFVCLLIAVPALFLILPDLLGGGRRSTPLRYFIPSSLGIQIAVAYLLSSKITPGINLGNWQQKLWQIITVVIVSSGVFSCALISQSDTWWTKGREYYHTEVAKIVNPTNQPLVIATWFDIRTLSHSLATHVVLQDIRPLQEVNSVGKGFSNVFVYQSKAALDYLLKENPNYTIDKTWKWKRQTTPVNTTQTTLWKLKIGEENY
ncbi:glycosyltransferase family 39 protein [Coleofasciculus sp.]|uniref:glycosyltransferase family 39 protein n=1 Tax=Coleofasciculus sp. TaxID=3100458 RepID=UPI003A163CCA